MAARHQQHQHLGGAADLRDSNYYYDPSGPMSTALALRRTGSFDDEYDDGAVGRASSKGHKEKDKHGRKRSARGEGGGGGGGEALNVMEVGAFPGLCVIFCSFYASRLDLWRIYSATYGELSLIVFNHPSLS